jgi:hypothetical protein
LHWRSRGGFRAEVDHSRERTAACFHMGTARTVARLALQLSMTERTVRIVGTRMLGLKDSGDRRIAMATETRICPLIAQARF